MNLFEFVSKFYRIHIVNIRMRLIAELAELSVKNNIFAHAELSSLQIKLYGYSF